MRPWRYVPARTSGGDRTRLFVVGDDVGWSIDDDSTRLAAAARRLGYMVAPGSWAQSTRRQAVFLPDHFGALRPRWLQSSHHLGLSYFHGRPGTPGYPEFDEAYETLKRYADRVARSVARTRRCRTSFLRQASGPAGLRIPIGVDLARFPRRRRIAGRLAALGLPMEAFVVGSFKDESGLRKNSSRLVRDLTSVATRAVRISRISSSCTGLARVSPPGAQRLRHSQLPPASPHAMSWRVSTRTLDAAACPVRQRGPSRCSSRCGGVPLVTTRVGRAPGSISGRRQSCDLDDEASRLLLRASRRPQLGSGSGRRGEDCRAADERHGCAGGSCSISSRDRAQHAVYRVRCRAVHTRRQGGSARRPAALRPSVTDPGQRTGKKRCPTGRLSSGGSYRASRTAGRLSHSAPGRPGFHDLRPLLAVAVSGERRSC
jgi:hypothetical protein